jgi:hypothetical protein
VWSLSGVVGEVCLSGRKTTDGLPIHVAALDGLTGSVNEGKVTLRGRVTDRPYRCAVGVHVDLDFATASVKRAGVLRCDNAIIAAYNHPNITITGQGVRPSPVKSLTP